MAYNTADTETTGVLPFFANHRWNTEVYKTLLKSQGTAEKALLQVDQLKELHQELATDIKFLAARSAIYYNEHRSVEPTLEEGEKVYLIRKNIKTKRPSDKLDNRKLGPFRIKRVVGPVNYELSLPRTMNIHPIFHISLLERAPDNAPPAPVTEIEPVNPEAEYEVEGILDYKRFRGQIKYLVK